MKVTRFLVEFPKVFNVKWQEVVVDRNTLNGTDIIKIEFRRVSIEDAPVMARTNWMIDKTLPLDLKIKLCDPAGSVLNEWHLVNSKIKEMFFDFGNVNWDPTDDTPIEAVGYITVKPEKVIILK